MSLMYFRHSSFYQRFLLQCFNVTDCSAFFFSPNRSPPPWFVARCCTEGFEESLSPSPFPPLPPTVSTVTHSIACDRHFFPASDFPSAWAFPPLGRLACFHNLPCALLPSSFKSFPLPLRLLTRKNLISLPSPYDTFSFDSFSRMVTENPSLVFPRSLDVARNPCGGISRIRLRT